MRKAIILASTFFMFCSVADAAPNLNFYETHAVRIEVRGATPKDVASSGFLWETNDRVVTSLHAIPLDGTILVKCGNDVRNATLIKMLVNEDLALLKVLPSRSGVVGLPKCQAFTSADLGQDPGHASERPLYAYGWHGDASTAQPIKMYRGVGGQLQKLVPKNVVSAIQKFGIPSVSKEIYAMRNGSLPGYSGALVVDANHKLVAVVDGGLNDGAAGFTWAIPAEYLRLFSSPAVAEVTDRTQRAIVPKWLYSTALPEPASGSVIEYSEIDSLTDKIFKYQWFHTKTLSLSELAHTATDKDGLFTIYNAYGHNVDPNLLSYDIYEDLGYGLIIAVPRYQPLIRKEVSGYPGYEWLKSEPQSGESHTQYEQTLWSVSTPTFPRQQIHPDHPDFFHYKIGELLADCNQPGSSYCHVDPDTLRNVSFPNGNKILRVGFGIRSKQHDGTDYYYQDYYDYYSIAVRDGVAFRAFLRLSGNSNYGPSPCPNDSDRICANPSADQLKQMIAVQLTTFANLGTSSVRSRESDVNYSGRTANAGTLGKGYFEGNRLRFYNSRGKLWHHYYDESSESVMVYVEYDRDADFAYLTDNGYDSDISSDTMFFAVPLGGGEYRQRTSVQAQWQIGGSLKRP